MLVIAARDNCVRLDIYFAISREQKRRGLMFVRKLPARSGMLFVYRAAGHHSMWMKNTYIPLDIVFAAGDGRVVTIARDTTPQSLKSIAPSEAVNYVLELNAGTADALGIAIGSQLLWQPADSVVVD